MTITSQWRKVKKMALIDLVRDLCSLNDDNLAERVMKDSDVQWCLSELLDILEQEEKPNEALTCKGCVYLEEIAAPCACCARMKREVDYYLPPEGEEET